MKWLYDEQIVSTVFLVLIAATPAAAAAGILIQRLLAGRLSQRAAVLWTVFGLAGPANYGLWCLYNGIEDYWGLDRVEPLLINFAIFIVLGVAIGLILRVLLQPEMSESQPPSPNDESPVP